LGTVDGFMYAIPVLAVFRRNTSGFAKNTNQNGGVASPGPSDRPDGLFYDIIVERDVADLRMGTSYRGWNYSEVLEKNFTCLLDNSLRTEWFLNSIGGGTAGHTIVNADEIGTLPGNNVDTGDTPGATFIGQFDYTRRFFSDRAVYEILTHKVSPGDPSVSTGTWQAGTTVTINPTSIAQYPFAPINFASRAPALARILDVVGARIYGTSGIQAGLDVAFTQTNSVNTQPFPIQSLQNLGVAGAITLTMGTPPVVGMTTEPLFIDLLVAYPDGSGLTKTPTGDYAASSFVVNNPGSLPVGAPVSFSAMQTQAFDYAHRETQIQYKTSQLTYTFSADSTFSITQYTLPERAFSIVAVRINGVPLGGAGATVDSAGRVITLFGATNPGDLVAVDYLALRPMPQSGVQMTIYYEARAPQTIRAALLGTSANLIPRWISPYLYVLTSGSGSPGVTFPFPYAYVQTGGVLRPGSTWPGEHALDGMTDIFLADFNASTGYLRVPTLIPYTPDPDQVNLQRINGDIDIEDRTLFSSVPTNQYIPSAFGSPLSDARTHKVVLPTIMETSADSTFGRKGTLIQVLFTRWADFDAENSIRFDTALNNRTTASLFRVNGNLLNTRS
jgi:hypothetical protein